MTEKEYMPDGPNNPPEQPPVTPSDEAVVPPVSPEGDPIFEQSDTPTMPTEGEERAESPQKEVLGADHRVDINELFEEFGQKEKLDALTEDERKIITDRFNTVLNKESDPDDVFNFLKEMGTPADKAENLLHKRGFTEEQIGQVFKGNRREELPSEIPQEQYAEIPKAQEIMDGVESEEKKLNDTVKAFENGDISKEEAEEEIKKTKGKIHDWLFNGDSGLLRDEHRIRRLAVKPLVSTLLALLVLYLASLHAITKGSAKKVGG